MNLPLLGASEKPQAVSVCSYQVASFHSSHRPFLGCDGDAESSNILRTYSVNYTKGSTVGEGSLSPGTPPVRWTGLVMLGIVISTATGFLREAVIANFYGASRLVDAYLIAFTIPEFLFVLLTTVLGASLIPVFVQRQQEGGEQAAWRFLGALELGLVLVLIVGVVLGMALAPMYMPFLAPGFGKADLELTVDLSRVMFPAVVVMGVSASASGVLNVYRRFSLPTLAVAAYNIVFAAAAVLLKDTLGVSSLALGVAAGAVAQLAIQLPQLLRRYPGGVGFHIREPGLGRFFRLAFLLLVGYAIHHVTIIVDRMMASNLEAGSIAALNYGYRVTLLVGQLVGMAVATVYFPGLSQMAAAGEGVMLRRLAARALRLIVLLGVPATVGLALLRVPVVRVLFQRGEFDERATALAASLVLFFAAGTLADALCQPLWRVFYALQRTSVVIYVNSIKTALRILLNLALIPLLAQGGIALSFTLGLTVQLVILVVLLGRQLGTIIDREMAGFVGKVALATGVMGVVLYWTSAQAEQWLGGDRLLHQLLLLVSASILGLGIFGAAAYSLRVQEVRAAADEVYGQLSRAWAALRGAASPRQQR